MQPGCPAGQGGKVNNSDDDLPRPAARLLVPPPLDLLGVTELTAYIAALEAEISRVRGVIAAKSAHKTAAAAFFRTPPA
jgi:uncharacterized small protein (DUF1192 family)